MARNLSSTDESKVTTVRLPASLAAELEAIARVENIAVSEAIREAIAAHIEARRKDDGFVERLRRRVEEDRAILEKLAQT